MAMSMKTSKKMKGFMCHSPSSTAVCTTQDYRSVIVSGRLNVTGTKYARLGDRGRVIPPPFLRSYPVPSVNKNLNRKKAVEACHDSLAISSNRVDFQVVVMRVSLHCQGCAGKVKKHLSKMEGVTSFSIELESKKVTVIGHVSPSSVLESISKVKKAEFWHC